MSQIRKGERVTRRDFLVRTGLATGAALGARLLAALEPSTTVVFSVGF